MNSLDSLRGLQRGAPIPPNRSMETKKQAPADATSFKETLSGFMSDVNSMQNSADASMQKLAAGEVTDVHQVMHKVEEAKTAFNMMMEIRGKVMEAYQEVIRMKI